MLNDPAALRDMLLKVARNDLYAMYCQQRVAKAERAVAKEGQGGAHAASVSVELAAAKAELAAYKPLEGAGAQAAPLDVLYSDFERDAFLWLTSENTDLRELADDVIDTLRALRCADALRQRGTVLKTSGNYEVFCRPTHGQCSLRLTP